MEFLFYTGFGLFTLLALGFAIRRGMAFRAVLAAVSEELGVELHASLADTRLEGLMGPPSRGMYAKVYYESSDNSSCTHFELEVPISPSFRLGREGVGSAFLKVLQGEDVQIHVDHFDREFYIEAASESVAAALLGHEARGQIVALFERYDRAEISKGKLSVGIDKQVMDVEVCVAAMRALEALGETFLNYGPENVALGHHALHDSHSGFRHRCLSLLKERFPEQANTAHIAQSALLDRTPQVRMLAASIVGGERGLEVLLGCARDSELSARVRAEAIRYLPTCFAHDAEALATLQALLAEPNGVVASAALSALVDIKQPPSMEMVMRHGQMLIGSESLLGLLYSFTIPKQLHATAEKILLKLLSRRGDEEDTVRRIALLLANVGSLESIRHLRPFSEGLMRSRGLKEAAQSAIEGIHRRHGGEAGGLSIAEHHGVDGALSTVQDGGLSVSSGKD